MMDTGTVRWAARCTVAAFSVWMGACGDDGTKPGPSVTQEIVDGFVCPDGSSAIVPGENTLMVNGMPRTFIADFPSDPSAPMGVLFSWHGYNQPEGDHHRLSNLNPNGDPERPLVVITPDDVDLELPQGLDWHLEAGTIETNVDLQFFEVMLGCLNAQYAIDSNRIHSLGYSAGSVFSALLHSVYPKLVRSIVAISGMWFNDPAQVNLIAFGSSVLNPTWPALDPEDDGTILLTHGGRTDIAAGIINLEAMAQAAFPFLATAERAVIDCPHESGHTGHPDVGPEIISKFLSENPADRESPYWTGGFTGFPASCALRLP